MAEPNKKRTDGDDKSVLIATDHELSGSLKLADIRGVPDEMDYKNLKYLIDIYDRVHPYPDPESIRALVEGVRTMRKKYQTNYNEFNELGKGLQLRHTISIPEALLKEIKRGYPNIFKDKLQYRWFLRKFPQFRVSEKY